MKDGEERDKQLEAREAITTAKYDSFAPKGAVLDHFNFGASSRKLSDLALIVVFNFDHTSSEDDVCKNSHSVPHHQSEDTTLRRTYLTSLCSAA